MKTKTIKISMATCSPWISLCWAKDKFGVSWQIIPRVLIQGITSPDTKSAKRVMQAMMTMKKIDIAKIELARRGGAARRS